MTEEYIAYLQSDKWKQKRQERLAISQYKCAACGSNKHLDVHHLTYQRIFNEEMSDLLPLCRHHHNQVEVLVKRGLLPRSENVLFLATETVRLLNEGSSNGFGHFKKKKKKKDKHNKPVQRPADLSQIATSNDKQKWLMEQPWFVDIVFSNNRDKFKEKCRAGFCGKSHFPTWMANAFALYQRIHW